MFKFERNKKVQRSENLRDNINVEVGKSWKKSQISQERKERGKIVDAYIHSRNLQFVG